METQPMSLLGLPVGANPDRDIPWGTDELGNPQFRASNGTVYSIRQNAIPPRQTEPGTLARAGEVGKEYIGGAIQSLFDAVTAPRRALSGEGVMYGDALNTAGMLQLGGAAVARPKGSLGSGMSRMSDALPAARNESEAMARRILEMRAAGRAGEVTDAMMAQADPQYMYRNTPLPMDYESRMARAIKQGFDVNDEMYRGDAPRQYFDTGRGQRDQIGVTMSSRPDVAASYIPARGEGGVYPLMSRGQNDAVIGAHGQNWNVIDRDSLVDFQNENATLRDYIPDSYFEPYDVQAGTDFLDTNDLSRMFQGYGADRVRFSDLVDRGASARYYGPESSMPSDVMMVADPANVRSRFARFDPEFSHLSNLSAANVSPAAGLLGMSADDERRKITQFLNLLGL